MSESIKEYWDSRARQETQKTTNDVFQRELEIKTTIAHLQNLKGAVLDVGCGDGFSTLSVARALPESSFFGVDYSPNMIEAAKASRTNENVEFAVADVTSFDLDKKFQAAYSMRCLINLASKEAQADALARIARHLAPGGIYLALENFVEGQDELNRARAAIGLPPIPIRWHNLFFGEPEFRSWVEPHFELVELINFSSAYYYATRVIYSKMCQMRNEPPDYQHEIHRLAVDLPLMGNFSPIRLAVLRRRA